MKIAKKIAYIAGFIGVIALGIFLRSSLQSTAAPSCSADASLGNLFGIVTASNLPDPIYISLDTWNADPLGLGNSPSTVDFSVKFDRNTGLWSGRAWSENVGWIEFDSKSLEKQAIVEDVTGNSLGWGNWDGIINIDDIKYSTQSGSFSGIGTSYDYTGDPADPGDDVYVGLGDLDFSGVTYVAAGCVENVNLFLNDTPSLYRTNCPISAPKIKWTSDNVSNCQTDTGLWNSPGTRATENKTGETASGGISSNGSQLFRIKCIGDTSGATVYGSAIMSCGTGPGVINNNSEINAPGYIEV